MSRRDTAKMMGKFLADCMAKGFKKGYIDLAKYQLLPTIQKELAEIKQQELQARYVELLKQKNNPDGPNE